MSVAAEAPAFRPPALVRRLGGLSKRLIYLIPVSMALGLIVGRTLDLSSLKVAIIPLTMLMVYPMLVNFRPREALSIRHGKAVGTAMLLNFIAIPLLAWALAQTFFSSSPSLFVGMVLIGLFPTSGMTISWTGFAKGNVGAAVSMTVIGLLAAGVLAPLYLLLLAGRAVDVDVLGVAQTVFLVVLIPMMAGVITRTLLLRRLGPERYQTHAKPVFPGISTLGVVAIVFLAMGLKADMILSSPQVLGYVLIPLGLFYAVAFTMTTLIGKGLLGRFDGIACVYGTVMRNLSIALGIAIASFGPEAALVLAVAYVVQVQAAAWYVKLSDSLFGRAPAQEAAVTG